MKQFDMPVAIRNEDIEGLVRCPLCGSNETAAISEAYLGGVNYLSTAYCHGCSLVFRSRRPGRDWFQRYWSAKARMVDPENAAGSELEKRRHHRYRNIALWAGRVVRAGRVLDIGTGTGHGLTAFADQGWSVAGLEPDPSRAHVARRLGLEIADAPLEIYCSQDRDFDLVTLVHTLEHFHDPLGALKAIASQIRHGGYLYVEVPDILNYVTWRDSLHFAHLSNFSAHTLSQTLFDAGLDPRIWLQPKTAPHGAKHVGVFAQKASGPAPDADRKTAWISLEQVRGAYLKGMTGANVGWPVRYAVDAIEHYSSLRYWPRRSEGGVLRLERHTRIGSALRKIAATPLRELFGRLLAKVLRRRDPDFETIRAIDGGDAANTA